MSKKTWVYWSVLSSAILAILFMSSSDVLSHGWARETQTYKNPDFHDDGEYRHFHVGGFGSKAYSCNVSSDTKIYTAKRNDAEVLMRRYSSMCSNIDSVSANYPDPGDDRYYVAFGVKAPTETVQSTTPTPETSTTTPVNTPTTAPTPPTIAHRHL
jgi:hypothetical protein